MPNYQAVAQKRRTIPPRDPYDTQRNYGSPVANGTMGSQTPASVLNATAQRTATKPAGDPASAFGDAANAWAQTLQGYITGGGGLQEATQSTTGGPRPFTGAPPVYGGGGMWEAAQAAGNETPTPLPIPEGPPVDTVPPPTTTPPPNGTTPPPSGTTPPPVTTPPPTTTPPPPGPPLKPQSDPDRWATPPPGVNPQTWQKAVQWADTPGYSWLIDDPTAIERYEQEAGILDQLGIKGLDFTVWAKYRTDKGSPLASQHPDPLAPPWGEDPGRVSTALRYVLDTAQQYGVDAARAYKVLLERPNIVTEYQAWAQQAATRGIEGVDLVDWMYHKGFDSPLYARSGNDTYANAYKKVGLKPPSAAQPNGGRPGFVPDPVSLTPPPASPNGTSQRSKPTSGDPYGRRPPPAPPAPPPGATPPPTNQTGGNDPSGLPQSAPNPLQNPTLPNFDEVMRQQILGYQQGMNPLFERQRDDVAKRTTQGLAISGALNSGGAGTVFNDAMSQQYAQEQATSAPEISKIIQSSQQLAVDKYKADVAAFVQQTQIKSEADLKKLALDLEKYGIDKNMFMREFEAKLAASTSRDVASINAAAQSAAASAAAQASMYNADLDYRLGSQRLSYDDIFNKRQYDLGVLGINRDIYNTDQDLLYKYNYLKWLMSPEYRISQTGQPPTGGQIVF